jgi:hypothetical protein
LRIDNGVFIICSSVWRRGFRFIQTHQCLIPINLNRSAMTQFLSIAMRAAALRGAGVAVAGIELQAMCVNIVAPPGAGVS